MEWERYKQCFWVMGASDDDWTKILLDGLLFTCALMRAFAGVGGVITCILGRNVFGSWKWDRWIVALEQRIGALITIYTYCPIVA